MNSPGWSTSPQLVVRPGELQESPTEMASKIQRSSREPSAASKGRRGGVLVEFALVSFALYMLLAALIEMGRAVFASQVVQTAAETMARELAGAPLPGTATFQQALASPYVRARIYDERHLVVDLDAIEPGPELDAHFSTLPIVNQMLRPVMISERVGDRYVLRYPGALLQATGAEGSYFTVRIPRVIGRTVEGVETIDWVGVVEEVLPATSEVSHFGIDAPLRPFRGLASVRVNYPYQASTLTAFTRPGETIGGSAQLPVSASDAAVSDTGFSPDESVALDFVNPADPAEGSPYAGQYGLGRQYILTGQSVRPWRKLLSAQAVRRREVTLQ